MMENTQQYVQEPMVQEVDKKQRRSLMTTAMLTASLGFIATCLLGYLFTFVFAELVRTDNLDTGLDVLYAITGISLSIVFILAILWKIKMKKWSLGVGILIVSLFCFANGIGFGALFYVLQVKDLMIIFGMTGFILLGTYGISKVMSDKVALTLPKIVMFLIITYAVGMLIVFLATYFTTGIGFNEGGLIMLAAGVSGLISIIYLAHQFWLIQKKDTQIVEESMRKKVGMFHGFMILVNLVGLIYDIASFFLSSDKDKEKERKEKEEKDRQKARKEHQANEKIKDFANSHW